MKALKPPTDPTSFGVFLLALWFGVLALDCEWVFQGSLGTGFLVAYAMWQIDRLWRDIFGDEEKR